MQVFKTGLFLLAFVVLSCKKPTLEEFHKELCYEKMDQEYVDKINRIPDDVLKGQSFTTMYGYYIVSKWDLGRNHLLKEGDVVFRVDDCIISNLSLFYFRFAHNYEEEGYFDKVEILFYYTGFAKPKIAKEHDVWIQRNNDISLIRIRKEGDTIIDPCDETCYEH